MENTSEMNKMPQESKSVTIDSMSSETITAWNVLECMFGANENVWFRIFPDRKDDKPSGESLSCQCGKYPAIEEKLKSYNAQNKGIGFVVNFGGSTDSSITRINIGSCVITNFQEGKILIFESCRWTLHAGTIGKGKTNLFRCMQHSIQYRDEAAMS